MSDPTTATIDPTAALRIPEPAPAAPPAPAAASAPNPVQATDLPPQALKDRLDQARQKATADLLAKLGGAKPEDIEAKLKRLQELEDASLSERERTEKEIASLRVQAAEAERYRKLFGEQTAAELAALSDEQRAAVQAFAGDDPVEQHRMVQAFRMAGAVKQAGGVAPLPVPPANTVPAGTAPAPAPSAKTLAEQYAAIRERDPIAGQFFYQQHARELTGA